MGKKINRKQQRFCEEYVIDWNATRAAIAAGYSVKTAKQIATENLSKPYLREYIDEIQKDLSKLSGVTALRNILELKKIAYASMSQFKDDWMTEKEFDSLSEEQLSCISDVQYQTKTTGGTTETIVKFKLHDKQRAIENLNKMLGFNAPEEIKQEVTQNDVKPIEIKIIPSKYTQDDEIPD